MARRITLDFLKTETASGSVLGFAALAALIAANSPWAADYFAALKSYLPISIGDFTIRLTLSDWVKEGLMALFFLIVGLEIKHEILKGELSDPRRLAAPVLAAAGGMIAPALVYLKVAEWMGGPTAGWSIPVATDIAFAVAVFALVARGLPASLRIFLLTLAIVDDLGAILIIAAMFSQGVQTVPLAWALGGLIALGALARQGRLGAPLWTLGFLWVWYFTLQAELSTSLAGVAFACIVPINARVEGRRSPLKSAMEVLHPWVAFGVLPLFAFAKAGFSFAGLSFQDLLSPVALGIAAGLFLGKQAGVMIATAFTVLTRLGKRPSNATWAEIYGVSLLCGVGFTMSLFIGALAFPGALDSPIQSEVKLGVLSGSLASAVVGSVVLARCSAFRRRRERTARAERYGDESPESLANIDLA
ncbi:MAG: NhaA family Na+:H+ antiporter [Brevundimonas sp.]|jgi:NhaA family Na+:H+ antiporter|uniref:Na+/H+ antiporter NhaA n=1 Tax=Brevundimonas sp. TaxID=1871086 RepID=UPI0039E3F26C